MRYLVLLALFITALARAEVVSGVTELTCSDRKVLLEVLDKYSEVPLARGETRQGWLVVYINPETLTWTMVEKIDDDVYCYVAAGQDFVPIPDEVRRAFQEQRRLRYN